MFSKFVNFVSIDLKICTHSERAYAMYIENKSIQITYVSMATKYSIINHKTFFNSANNDDIGQKFLPDTYDHTIMLYKYNDLES